jgi:hypothetical protein
MAKISQGNALTVPQLQAGYTIEDNGYGVLTCKAVYKCDASTAADAISRSDVFSEDNRLFCHKVSVSYGALDVATITADYIGITGETGWSSPEVGASTSLTTETITTHPRFMTTDALSIAGVGTGTNTAPIYAPAFSITTLLPYSKSGIWEGDNGAIFELKNGGKFLGFYSRANSTATKLYGRTSYLAPTSTFRGVIYTNDSTNVPTFLGMVGKTMKTRSPDSLTALLPSYYGDDFEAADETDQLLISSVSVEDYGTIFKFVYELRFNREGYPLEVYDTTNV